MTDIRSDHARARAMALLAIADPNHHDVESCRLRELALQYIAEADRLEAERGNDATEPSESISAALDDVARNYFERTLYGASSSSETSFGAEGRQRGPDDDASPDGTRQIYRTS